MSTNLSIHINNRVVYGLGLWAVGVGSDRKNCSLDNVSLLAITLNQCNQCIVLYAQKLVLCELNIRNDTVIEVIKNRIVFQSMPFFLKTAFNSFIISSKSKPLKKFYFEVIEISIRVKNLPKNLSFKASNRRSLQVIYFDCQKHGLSPKLQWF